MLRYQLLAIDIDGTLVNSRDELTPGTRAALVRAGEAGIHVVLATGRRYSLTLHLVQPLAIDVPLVTASGALVKDPADHRTLYCAEFDRAVLCQALADHRRVRLRRAALRRHVQPGVRLLPARDAVARGRNWPSISSAIAECGRVWPNMLRDPPPAVFGGFAMGSQRQMLDLESRLHEAMPGKLATHVLRSPRYRGFLCELAPAGVTKWSAIRRLAAQWGIAEEADLRRGRRRERHPMIRGAGLGMAMGNALPLVKAAAARVAPSQDEDGLVQVVQWLLAEGRD